MAQLIAKARAADGQIGVEQPRVPIAIDIGDLLLAVIGPIE
jgi:hypothetical protein